MLSQISVSPGLMRQSALLNGKVMQGEMSRLALRLHGAGEVTRVQGDDVLAWNVEPTYRIPPTANWSSSSTSRRRTRSRSWCRCRRRWARFRKRPTPSSLQPENATRFAGTFRIVNEGAVRLEVLQASGLSQISPEQFPGGEPVPRHGQPALCLSLFQRGFRAAHPGGPDSAGSGRVARCWPITSAKANCPWTRKSSWTSAKRRLRELLLNIPKGYAVAQLTASGLSDYFTGETPDHNGAELRLVYGQPIAGRQVVQLRLERNQSLGETNWTLPRIEVAQAKSVRGFVGVSADSGFRLTPERTQALTEIATAFFPRQLAGIQAAFRLSEPDWQATLRVERLPQTVQADVFHLFSIGEGIAYGSSVMNYVVSGAPVSAFHVELSDEYFNVEFTGKDIRNWEKTTNGWTGAIAHAGVRRLHAAGHLRAAVQAAGRDARLHRRAPAGRAIRVRPHARHQRVSIPGEAGGRFARSARTGTRRSAAGIPPVLRPARARRRIATPRARSI